MKLSFKCMPLGAIPYDDVKLVTQMMVRLFENVPFIPLLPNTLDISENLSYRTFNQSKIITRDVKKYLLKADFSLYNHPEMYLLDTAFNNPTLENLEQFAFTSVFLETYFKIISRIKPEHTVINLYGPFSFSCLVKNKTIVEILTDKNLRKYIIQYFSVVALWIIKKVKEISEDTTPIIMFEEPLLKDFSRIKRNNDEITESNIVTLYSKIFSKLKENGAIVGVQSLEKCNWQLAIDSHADIISFDAYNNPSNLNIIADKINHFIANGGYINWGIVPVKNETIIKSLNIDTILKRFVTSTNDLINNGVSADALFSHSLVSVQGDTCNLPILFAEKAIMLTEKLSQKLSTLK